MSLENRKQELLEELNKIRAKEVEEKLIDLESTEGSAYAQLAIEKAKCDNDIDLETKKAEIKNASRTVWSHIGIMTGDFFIKFLIALAISAAFMHIVYTGTTDGMEPSLIGEDPKSGQFQLLSVVGPLFGMVLQYYFGTKKKSANGE